jgi:hypothetical protein
MHRKKPSKLACRYGHVAARVSHEELLEDAMKDWLSGRAYLENGGRRFVLRPLINVGGIWTIGSKGRASAPWSKAVMKAWGGETSQLHHLAHEKYGHRTKHELLMEMAKKRGEIT